MSYLLTEIALEMLGYKFYDTNGVFHLTNFQQSISSQTETNPDEPTVLQLIDQPDPLSTKNSSTVTNGYELPLSSRLTGDKSIPIPTTRRTPARALSKIITYESEKIHNQLYMRLEKSIQNHNETVDNLFIDKCCKEESRRALKDAEEIKEFREFLEERLRRIDSRPYDKYVRTFGKD